MFELVPPLSGVPINLAISGLIRSHSFSGRSAIFFFDGSSNCVRTCYTSAASNLGTVGNPPLKLIGFKSRIFSAE